MNLTSKLLVAACLTMGIPAFAGGLYVNNPENFLCLPCGQFGITLQNQFGAGNVTTDTNTLGDLSGYSAVVVLARNFAPVLTPTETTNMMNFVNSGGRLMILGENSFFFSAWDNSFLSPLGGTLGSDYGPAATVVPITLLGPGYLTQGLTTINVAAAGTVGSGGTPLSNPEVLALFGPQNNVLVGMDMSMLYGFDTNTDSLQFYSNVAGWLAGADVAPEPASVGLTGSVLAGALLFARRRRVRA